MKRFPHTSLTVPLCAAAAVLLVGANVAAFTLDLAAVSTQDTGLLRLHGSTGDGAFGVPVAGGVDFDGDGHADVAMASMLASPNGVFGTGTIAGTFDTATSAANVLRLHGTVEKETAGSEIWSDDVDGDGLGDLLIARQNFGPSLARTGAGALSIVFGSAALRAHAAALTAIDLDAPPTDVTVLTIVGAQALGRFGIWMRTGDVDGDGTADIVVGADQEDYDAAQHAGAVYVVRGGAYLATGGSVDLGLPGTNLLTGHLARITPPAGSAEYHLGATCLIADLDGNGRGEVLAAAALNRAGATLVPLGGSAGGTHAIGGAGRGTVFIAWDDNFPTGPWDATTSFRIDASPGARTVVHGAPGNQSFGEELIGGLDFDGDGLADLFVGDIVGDLSPGNTRFASGAGTVFYDAAGLRGRTIEMDAQPADVLTSTFLGAATGDIAADTAAHGDFDGDGRADLMFSAPHHSPLGRNHAGALYVFFGQQGGWPAVIDLRDPLAPQGLRAATVFGAVGTNGSDSGDTLAYSAAAGDIDGDGRTDLITNEMEANGLAPGTVDDGNLIVVSGALLAGLPPNALCPPVPRAMCRTTMARRSVMSYRTGATPEPDAPRLALESRRRYHPRGARRAH